MKPFTVRPETAAALFEAPHLLQDMVKAGWIKPCYKTNRCTLYLVPIWRRVRRALQKVDPLPSHRPGYNLHWTGLHRPPCPHGDSTHSAPRGWKQCGVPAEQPFCRQRVCKFLRGIKHHLNNAFDVAASGESTPDIKS